MDLKELLLRLDILEKKVLKLDEIEKTVAILQAENAILKERLSKYEHPKNSNNSSVPPSKDENRPKPNQTLRVSSGKSVGGQLGREGKTLRMSITPDSIIKLEPAFCKNCASSLAHSFSTKEQIRQTIDIPPIKAIYTQYETYSKLCTCGCRNVADFPEGVNAPISYGQNVEALVAYLHTRQFLPFARMKEILNDALGISISEGGIHCLLERLAQKTIPVYELIKKQVQQSKVIGTDETGINVNGKKDWFWTWQTPRATFIIHSNNRGSATIDSVFPNGFANSTLVHDGWKAQLKTHSLHHQTCIAHIQRHLNYLIQISPEREWEEQFKKMLHDALLLKQNCIFESDNYIIKRNGLLLQLNNLLHKPPDKNQKERCTFYKRMCREKNHLFTFLYIKEVPADNNASERAIRNVKVKQKISGQFKVASAAQNFAMIRSVIDTAIKNGQNVLNALVVIAKNKFNFQY
jgi:transposase